MSYYINQRTQQNAFNVSISLLGSDLFILKLITEEIHNIIRSGREQCAERSFGDLYQLIT